MAKTSIFEIRTAADYYEFKNQLHRLILKKYYNKGGNYVLNILKRRMRHIMKTSPEFFGDCMANAIAEYGEVAA